MSAETLPVFNHPEVGPITTIRDDGLGLGPRELGDLLAAHDPRRLDPVVATTIAEQERAIRCIPKMPGLILRWNNSPDRPLPVAPDKATPFMVEANEEFDRLQRFGMLMLKRNIYVVEDDQRQKRPIIYTIVERHATDSLEAILFDTELRYRPDIQEQLVAIARTLTNYYAASETDQQALYDLDYGQCAQDGPLLDYDPKMYKGIGAKIGWIEFLHFWVDGYILPSDSQHKLLGKLNNLRFRLLENHDKNKSERFANI